MIRAVTRLLPALAVLAAVSCATYNEAALGSLRNVGVVAIYCDRRLNTETIENFTGVARSWTRSESYNLVPVAERVRSSLFNNYARSFPFALAEEARLLESEEYRGLGADATLLIPEQYAAVPGTYLPVARDTAAKVKKVIARFPEMDGFVWVDATYELLKKNEFLDTLFVRMRAALTLTVFDRAGRALLRHSEYAEDGTELRIVSVGAFPVSDLAAAAARTTTQASAQMARWLGDRGAR